MTSAQQVILRIENHGGTLLVEGENLVIVPAAAGLPVLDALRLYKPEIIALLQGRPADDETLGNWLLDRCVFDDRCASSTSGLYIDFASWAASRGLDTMVVSRQSFVKALQSEGFTMTPTELWHGLILREDFEAILK